MGKVHPPSASRLRLEMAAAAPGRPAAIGYVLAPWIDSLPAEGREILALLPVVDLNAISLAALARDAPHPPGAIAALMLADPFRRVHDMLGTLAALGVARVANFPTVQLVDGEAARALEGAGLGTGRELAALRAFRAAGLDVVGFARELRTARALLADGASMLVLHPGVALSDWRQRAAASAGVLRIVTALRAETSVPLLVYRPRGYGPELDAAVAAADGESGLTS